MWSLVKRLRENGTTVILTTHYIEEAEEMADRIGIINKGELVLVENTSQLMKKLGKKHLSLVLNQALDEIPLALAPYSLSLSNNGTVLHYVFDTQDESTRIPELLKQLAEFNIEFNDLNTHQSSLEEIFVDLVKQ